MDVKTPAKERPFILALLLMPVAIPVVLWGSWEAIQARSTLMFKVVFGLAMCLGTYLSAALLLWFNRFMQGLWRRYKVIP